MDGKVPAESRPWRRKVCARPWRHWCAGSSEGRGRRRARGGGCRQARLLANTSSVHFISCSCGEFACFLTALDGFEIKGDMWRFAFLRSSGCCDLWKELVIPPNCCWSRSFSPFRVHCWCCISLGHQIALFNGPCWVANSGQAWLTRRLQCAETKFGKAYLSSQLFSWRTTLGNQWVGLRCPGGVSEPDSWRAWPALQAAEPACYQEAPSYWLLLFSVQIFPFESRTFILFLCFQTFWPPCIGSLKCHPSLLIIRSCWQKDFNLPTSFYYW